MAAGYCYCLGIISNDFFLKDNKKAFILGLNVPKVTAYVQTRPGQSGSLVYSPRLQKVIGILVGGYSISSGISLGGINPFELNQTSFCLSAQYINEMLAE